MGAAGPRLSVHSESSFARAAGSSHHTCARTWCPVQEASQICSLDAGPAASPFVHISREFRERPCWDLPAWPEGAWPPGGQHGVTGLDPRRLHAGQGAPNSGCLVTEKQIRETAPKRRALPKALEVSDWQLWPRPHPWVCFRVGVSWSDPRVVAVTPVHTSVLSSGYPDPPSEGPAVSAAPLFSPVEGGGSAKGQEGPGASRGTSQLCLPCPWDPRVHSLLGIRSASFPDCPGDSAPRLP